jgi:hypothetical protein
MSFFSRKRQTNNSQQQQQQQQQPPAPVTVAQSASQALAQTKDGLERQQQARNERSQGDPPRDRDIISSRQVPSLFLVVNISPIVTHVR